MRQTIAASSACRRKARRKGFRRKPPVPTGSTESDWTVPEVSNRGEGEEAEPRSLREAGRVRTALQAGRAIGTISWRHAHTHSRQARWPERKRGRYSRLPANLPAAAGAFLP